jgi:hypothetical protein
MPDTKFDLGSVVMTRGVQSWYQDGFNPFPYIQRHASGDWGDELGEDDKRRNDEAVEKGLRILSAYSTDHGKMWIITEADRSATTLLRPEEY